MQLPRVQHWVGGTPAPLPAGCTCLVLCSPASLICTKDLAMEQRPTLAPALAEGPEVTEQQQISPRALPMAPAVARAVACGSCCHQHCSGSHVPTEHQLHLLPGPACFCQGTVPRRVVAMVDPRAPTAKSQMLQWGQGAWNPWHAWAQVPSQQVCCLPQGQRPFQLRVPAVLGRVAIPKKCRDRQRAAMECMIREL